MSHNITVEGGTSVRLPTAGKYCDRDIVITAEGGTENLDDVLTEQEELIAELQDVLKDKASGGDTTIEDAIITGTLSDYTNSRVTKCGDYVLAYSSVTRLNLPAVDSIPKRMCYNAESLYVVDMLGGGSAGDEFFLGCNNLSALILRSEKAVTTCKTDWYPFSSYVGVANITRNFRRSQWNTYGKIGHQESWTGLVSRVMGSVTYMTGTITDENDKPVWIFFQYVEHGRKTKTIAFVETEEEANALMEAYEQQYNAKSKTGVYVPREVLKQHRSATGWSLGGSQIRALEDYTVDGTVTGELDETKIAEVTK